jgi:hypothetical protein
MARRTRLIRDLKEINEGRAELATARRMDSNRIFDLDLSFHSQIVETSAGPRLLEIQKSTSNSTNPPSRRPSVTGVSMPEPFSMSSTPQ